MTTPPKLSSIVAMAQNRIIGRNNALIWHIPEDLKHFKRTTMGKPIIMGRKSYEALGKPLPGRANIVISRKKAALPDDTPTATFDDMESVESPAASGTALYVVTSIEAAIDKAKDIASAQGLDEIFITGGGEIYKQTLPITQRLYLTLLHRDYDGDTFFPAFDWEEWTVAEERSSPADEEKDRPALTFYTLERKNSGA
ncbi:MAG: dihydrofolate reductase [Alphaproteobacteria bacterium]|nr:dihydrofolate reductase [Alphaproteobacteria bacterium]